MTDEEFAELGMIHDRHDAQSLWDFASARQIDFDIMSQKMQQSSNDQDQKGKNGKP